MTNRRQFIAGTGAVLVTLPLGYSATKLLSDTPLSNKVTQLPRRPRAPSVMIVVPTYKEAMDLQQRLGNYEPEIKVVSVGSAVCGYGADYILLDHDCQAHAATHMFDYDNWINQTIRTRLMPGGKMIDTVARTDTFDYGNQHGFKMSFYDFTENVVNEQAFRIAKRHISYDDQVQAKVALYRWWMQREGMNV